MTAKLRLPVLLAALAVLPLAMLAALALLPLTLLPTALIVLMSALLLTLIRIVLRLALAVRVPPLARTLLTVALLLILVVLVVGIAGHDVPCRGSRLNVFGGAKFRCNTCGNATSAQHLSQPFARGKRRARLTP